MSVEDEVLRIHKKLSKMTSSGTVNIVDNLLKSRQILSATVISISWKNVVFIAG